MCFNQLRLFDFQMSVNIIIHAKRACDQLSIGKQTKWYSAIHFSGAALSGISHYTITVSRLCWLARLVFSIFSLVINCRAFQPATGLAHSIIFQHPIDGRIPPSRATMDKWQWQRQRWEKRFSAMKLTVDFDMKCAVCDWCVVDIFSGCRWTFIAIDPQRCAMHFCMMGMGLCPTESFKLIFKRRRKK